jgi:hypothetical protein
MLSTTRTTKAARSCLSVSSCLSYLPCCVIHLLALSEKGGRASRMFVSCALNSAESRRWPSSQRAASAPSAMRASLAAAVCAARAAAAAAAAPAAAAVRSAATDAAARKQTCACAPPCPPCAALRFAHSLAPDARVCHVTRCHVTVFELAAGLPRFGEGARVARKTWGAAGDCFWTVEQVKPLAVRPPCRVEGTVPVLCAACAARACTRACFRSRRRDPKTAPHVRARVALTRALTFRWPPARRTGGTARRGAR